MSHYQSKMVALAKANLEPEKLAELVKTARAHAGGMSKADKMKAMMSCEHDFGGDGVCTKGCGAREPKGASEFFKAHRLFVELDGEGKTEWVQITPGPGTFSHPRYGTVKITPATLNRYVENFDRQVYQEHIPIDAEHKTKLSGALGYYREMKVGHDGKPGVWARIELTERGKTLLDSGGFKYFSPEFYDEWEDPATGTEHKDVITGGAFTTRPFFKDKVLEPLAASELEEAEDDGWVGADGDLIDAIYELTADGLSDGEIVAAVEAFSEAMQFGGAGSGRYPKGSKHSNSSNPDAGTGPHGSGNGPQNLDLPMPPGTKVDIHMGKGRGQNTTSGTVVKHEGESIHVKTSGGSTTEFHSKTGDQTGTIMGQKANPTAATLLGPQDRHKPAAKSAADKKKEGEARWAALSAQSAAAGGAVDARKHNEPDGGKTMSDKTTEEGADEGVTPEQFAEVKAAADATAKAFAEAQAENKKMAERIEAMETDARTRRFTELVTGRGGANDGGPQWFGEPEKHVAMLGKLAKVFGEDSEEVKEYTEQQNAMAKAFSTSQAFNERGKATPGTTGASAQGRMEAKVKEWMSANPGKTYSEGVVAVAREDPKLYSEMDREFMTRTNKEFSRPV